MWVKKKMITGQKKLITKNKKLITKNKKLSTGYSDSYEILIYRTYTYVDVSVMFVVESYVVDKFP